MKKSFSILLVFLGVFVGHLWPMRAAQNGVAQSSAYSVASTMTVVTCPPPVTGQFIYCSTGTGYSCSNNGAAYSGAACISGGVPIAGLTGISVCNASGASCSPAAVSSGVATLDIPKNVTVTVGNPTVSVSATQGAVSASLQ